MNHFSRKKNIQQGVPADFDFFNMGVFIWNFFKLVKTLFCDIFFKKNFLQAGSQKTGSGKLDVHLRLKKELNCLPPTKLGKNRTSKG